MEYDYEELDDDISREIKSYCSGPVPPPGIRMVMTKMITPMWYLPYTREIVDLDVREDDVWLLGPPRCGTTWCQEMIWLVKNNFNFEKAKSTPIYDRFPYVISPRWLNRSKSDYFIQFLNGLESPRFMKSHLHKPHLPQELWTKKPKIVFMFRNPKDAAVSLFYLYKLMFDYTGTLELMLKAFIHDKASFNPFWKPVLDFWAMRHDPNVLFLTYDEMKKDLSSVIRRVADFLEVQCSLKQEADLLEHLRIDNMKKNKAVNFGDDNNGLIRVGESGGWKSAMSPEMVDMFDEWINKNLEGSDFPREGL